MRKITFLFILLCFYGKIAAQQQNQHAPEIIPPSPQSQIFEKYINHAITEYNGLPDISIPLYEIEMKGMKIPVVLSYHASGIKYKQFDGDVGAGWSLSVGGHRITRTVHGKSDLDIPFYDKQVLSGLEQNNKKWMVDKYLERIGTSFHTVFFEEYDGEYDEFTYSTPSTNGNFLISDRVNNTVAIADGKLDKISISKNEGSIIDENGFLYKFGKDKYGTAYNETSIYGSGSSAKKYTTAWPLMQINSPYNEIVNFNYKQYQVFNLRTLSEITGFSLTPASIFEFASGIYLCQYIEEGAANASVDPVTKQQAIDTISYLNKIEGIQENVFFYRTDRNNLNSPCTIDRIEIKDKKGNLIRKISFTYVTSPGSVSTANNKLPWHILLQSVKITGTDNTEKVYTFDYYAPPSNQNAYPDRWGYYAFSNNCSTEMEKKYFLYDDIGHFSYTSSCYNTENSCLRRTIRDYPNPKILNENDPVNLHSFSLKKITFPTGGYTEYIYEPNKISNGFGGGQRVKEIKSYSVNNPTPVKTIFAYGENESGTGVGISLSAPNLYSYTTKYMSDPLPHYLFMDRGVTGTCPMVKKSETVTYSRVPLGDISKALHVYYPKVSISQVDGNGNKNGKTVISYLCPNNYIFSDHDNLASTHYFGSKPRLKSKMIYNAQNTLQQQEIYNYSSQITGDFSGIKVFQMNSTTGEETGEELTGNWQYDWKYPYSYFYNNPGYYGYIDYSIVISKSLLTSKTTTLYTTNGNVTSNVSYLYDSKFRLTETSQTSSTGHNLLQRFTYPTTGSALDQKNMVNTVLEEVTTDNGKEVSRIKNNYPSSASQLMVVGSIQTSRTGAAGLQTEITFDQYDSRGNILQYTTRDGITVSFVWGYNQQYPVAKIVNATYGQVKGALNSTDNDLSYLQNYTDSQLKTEMNKLRTGLGAAHVYTYTYKPLVGTISETDPNGIVTEYDYDSLGRLNIIYDNDRNILQQFEYRYKNQ